MTLSELMLNVKDVGMEQLVFQSDIKTIKDVEDYQKKGYNFVMTEEQFKEKFDLPTDCIAYTPSISYGCLYFNRQTLAALNFPITLYTDVDYVELDFAMNIQRFYSAVKNIEDDVAKGDYSISIHTLPDRMRLEYFDLLIQRGVDFPDFYEKFLSFYTISDYGFGSLSRDTIEKILQKKTPEDKKKTKDAVSSLPDIVTIYRGQTKVGTPLEKAYSWTLDINIANFFAARMGTDDAEIVEARVSKDKIIEYDINGREQEVLVRFEDVEITSRIKLYGLEKLRELLPKVEKTYHVYKDKLGKLNFIMDDKGIHGKTHTLRVLLLSLLLAKQMGLSAKKTEMLATAAIYHDTRRKNDSSDTIHGYDAAQYYINNVKHPNPIVSFLIEYHSVEDEFGYKEIDKNPELRKQADIAKLLFGIFKDADALDRVRFGLQYLDVRYLRNEESKHFPLIARICSENIRT